MLCLASFNTHKEGKWKHSLEKVTLELSHLFLNNTAFFFFLTVVHCRLVKVIQLPERLWQESG